MGICIMKAGLFCIGLNYVDVMRRLLIIQRIIVCVHRCEHACSDHTRRLISDISSMQLVHADCSVAHCHGLVAHSGDHRLEAVSCQFAANTFMRLSL